MSVMDHIGDYEEFVSIPQCFNDDFIYYGVVYFKLFSKGTAPTTIPITCNSFKLQFAWMSGIHGSYSRCFFFHLLLLVVFHPLRNEQPLQLLLLSTNRSTLRFDPTVLILNLTILMCLLCLKSTPWRQNPRTCGWVLISLHDSIRQRFVPKAKSQKKRNNKKIRKSCRKRNYRTLYASAAVVEGRSNQFNVWVSQL